MIFFFFSFIISSSDRGTPAWWLNNWDSKNPMIALWSSQQQSWTVDPEFFPGVQQVRVFNLSSISLANDTFSLKIDGKFYSNPKLFNSTHLGGCVQEPSGELWTEYTIYNGKVLPIKLRRSYYLPPNELFYLVKYSFESVDGKKHEIKLLDLFRSGDAATGSCIESMCRFSPTQDLATISASIYTDKSKKITSQVSLSNGDWTNNENLLKQFKVNNGSFSTTKNYYSGKSVAVGSLYTFTVQGKEEVVIPSIRAFGHDSTHSIQILKDALLKTPKGIIEETNKRFNDWLQSGIVPQLKNQDALDLYYKSLLVLKNSQNPAIGTICSSLHIHYGNRNWMRDAIMAAFMLDASGHHAEFKLFMDWAETAELEEKGGFHTAYNTFTGLFDLFIEPQYDSSGLFLIAMNYHLQCFGDREWVKKKLPRLDQIAKLLMSRKYPDKLGPDDRSPWEELTDHHTKEFISSQFFPWTMGNCYGGLRALSKIHQTLNTTVSLCKDYLQRAEEIRTATIKHLWDSQNERLYRGRWALTFQPDERAESATLSCIFTGLLEGNMALSHLKYIKDHLTHLEYGLARYTGDPYFYSSAYNPCGEGVKETSAAEPVWPVVTAYAAWCEDIFGIDYTKRLELMVNVSAYGNMPTGEAVDPNDGSLIVPSSPDGFEHGGVYVFTTLLHEKSAKNIIETIDDTR